jgi:hypothetical protein
MRVRPPLPQNPKIVPSCAIMTGMMIRVRRMVENCLILGQQLATGGIFEQPRSFTKGEFDRLPSNVL